MESITIEDFNRHWDEGTPLREYYEFYIDRGHVVAEYRADCWDCGFHAEFTHRHPLLSDKDYQ